MARLYVVSTPIGNLSDTTFRAVDVLRAVARILAEDTRRTAVLLRHYDIDTPMVSAHEHVEAARAERVVGWLDAGEDLALVTDAGTPLVSDPGERIVAAVLAAGHDVVPVPGASAVLAALVASGLPAEPFTFLGFLPRSGQARAERLTLLARLDHTVVLYESPNRLAALLRDLADAVGGGRRVAVARELTKLHETVWRGTLQQAAAYYHGRAVRGEVVVVVEGAAVPGEAEPAAVEAAARVLAAQLRAEGRRPSAVARELSRRFGLPRNLSYQIAHEPPEESE